MSVIRTIAVLTFCEFRSGTLAVFLAKQAAPDEHMYQALRTAEVTGKSITIFFGLLIRKAREALSMQEFMHQLFASALVGRRAPFSSHQA